MNSKSWPTWLASPLPCTRSEIPWVPAGPWPISHWISVAVAELPVHSTPPMMTVLLAASAIKPVPVIVSTVLAVEEPVKTGEELLLCSRLFGRIINRYLHSVLCCDFWFDVRIEIHSGDKHWLNYPISCTTSMLLLTLTTVYLMSDNVDVIFVTCYLGGIIRTQNGKIIRSPRKPLPILNGLCLK